MGASDSANHQHHDRDSSPPWRSPSWAPARRSPWCSPLPSRRPPRPAPPPRATAPTPRTSFSPTTTGSTPVPGHTCDADGKTGFTFQGDETARVGDGRGTGLIKGAVLVFSRERPSDRSTFLLLPVGASPVPLAIQLHRQWGLRGAGLPGDSSAHAAVGTRLAVRVREGASPSVPRLPDHGRPASRADGRCTGPAARTHDGLHGRLRHAVAWTEWRTRGSRDASVVLAGSAEPDTPRPPAPNPDFAGSVRRRPELDWWWRPRVDSRRAWSLPTSRTERTRARYLNHCAFARVPAVVTTASRVPAHNTIHSKVIPPI
jgi:hypothetical protein